MEPRFEIGDRVIRQKQEYLVCSVTAGMAGAVREYRYGLVPWEANEDGEPVYPTFPIAIMTHATQAELQPVE